MKGSDPVFILIYMCKGCAVYSWGKIMKIECCVIWILWLDDPLCSWHLKGWHCEIQRFYILRWLCT